MNGGQFIDALGKVSDRYVMEALAYQPGKKRGWLRWGAAAACLGLTLAAARFVLPELLREPVSPVPSSAPESSGPAAGEETAWPEPETTKPPALPTREPELIIDWDGVVVNEGDGSGIQLLFYFDPEFYAEEKWGEAEVLNYYGDALFPGYIPEGYIETNRSFSETIYRRRESGELEFEQVMKQYKNAKVPDSGWMTSDWFQITVSRVGILKDTILFGETKATDFGGVPVTLTHASVTDGPRSDPAGHYDIYEATFRHKGIQYEVYAKKLELEEVIRIVAALINNPPTESFTVGSSQGIR